MTSEIQARVGLISGKIWQYLHENGETSIAQLKKAVVVELDVPMADSMLAMSLGWLLREDKLILAETGKGKGYRLMIDLFKGEKGQA